MTQLLWSYGTSLVTQLHKPVCSLDLNKRTVINYDSVEMFSRPVRPSTRSYDSPTLVVLGLAFSVESLA